MTACATLQRLFSKSSDIKLIVRLQNFQEEQYIFHQVNYKSWGNNNNVAYFDFPKFQPPPPRPQTEGKEL